MSSALRRTVPLLLFLTGAVALAWGASRWSPAPPTTGAALPEARPHEDGHEDGDEGDEPPAVDPARGSEEEPPSAAHDTPAPAADGRDPNVAIIRDGVVIEPPTANDYRCEMPPIEIPREPACDEGAPYPACRWQLPDEDVGGRYYHVWRNTTPEHRWAQPGLVSLVVAAARDYAARWPGHLATIGDLDAPGPRHQTHDVGHDVDLYLEHAMLDSNIGGGHYVPTYVGRPHHVVEMLRAQVLDLARILATCSRGRLRIYYNDPEIITPFLAWFDDHGFVSDVGPAMVEHNRLHRFHFHMTIADGMPTLPVAR